MKALSILFILFFSFITLTSCSKLDYEDKCREKNGTPGDPKKKDPYDPLGKRLLGQKKDICYCNNQNFNPYTNKDCEEDPNIP